jgi:hypothetical protein
VSLTQSRTTTSTTTDGRTRTLSTLEMPADMEFPALSWSRCETFSFCLIQTCWTCTRHEPKRCTLINVINKCFTLSVFIFRYRFFGIAETGNARGSPPGTTTKVQRAGFASVENQFVSVGTRAILDRRTSPRNGRQLRKPFLNLEALYKPP